MGHTKGKPQTASDLGAGSAGFIFRRANPGKILVLWRASSEHVLLKGRGLEHHAENLAWIVCPDPIRLLFKLGTFLHSLFAAAVPPRLEGPSPGAGPCRA